MADTFVQNGDVRLHAIDNKSGNHEQVPLLIVPGLAESAADYIDLIDYLAPRRCVAITLRGRGLSDAPMSGYSLRDHVSDIAAARATIDHENICLMAFSRGVAYGLGYAVDHALDLVGLILGDYPAFHSSLPPEFAERFLGTTWRGKPASERIAAHALRAIQIEAQEVVFWDRLDVIDCPSLILHGAEESGALLSGDNLDRYRTHLSRATVEGFPNSGHDLRQPNPEKFYGIISSFLLGLDAELPR